jgi:hypothetical protein
MAPTVDPLRAAATKALSQFFMATARDADPRHDFATMNGADYGAANPPG